METFRFSLSNEMLNPKYCRYVLPYISLKEEPVYEKDNCMYMITTWKEDDKETKKTF